MDFPLDREQDLLQLFSSEKQQNNLEQELDMWTNVQFNFIDDTPPVPENAIFHPPNNNKIDTTSTALASILQNQSATAPAVTRKKREPIESFEEKKKRNSEASARHRQKRKEREMHLQQTNEYLVQRNSELEALIVKMQLEIDVLKNLVLQK